MIVNQRDEGYEIYFHRSHALLAGVLARQWQAEYQPMRFVETLAAIIQHDDEERYWDEARHLNDVGMPLDFRTTSVEGTVKRARYNLVTAEQQHRWVALLISRHNHFLMAGKVDEDAELAAFVSEQVELRARWMRELEVSEDALERTYALFNWADTLSLLLCQRDIPIAGRWVEIAQGPDGEMSRLREADSGRLQIEPWRFTNDEFIVSAEVRIVAQASFKSEKQFREVLMSAPTETLTWTFAR